MTVNPFLFNAGLCLILGGALLFVFFTRLAKKKERDLLAEVRARDMEDLKDV